MGHRTGSGNTQTRGAHVSAFILGYLFRVPLIVRLDSSVPRGALISYFDRPVARIATCDYGTDNEDPNFTKSDGRNLLERCDKKKYLINLWDGILVKVDKQAQLPALNYSLFFFKF